MASELLRGLPPDAVDLLKLAGRLGRTVGARTFLVGGPVRDLLLGRPVVDLDLAVEGDTRRLGQRLARELNGRLVYHSRFRTGTVHLADDARIDIARTRTEVYSKPAVLPVVKPASIEADLVRRDFTINAMALEITPGRFERMLDPHSGRLDLKHRQVRALHRASFRDDPTRIFRAIRFAIRLEFEIEPETLNWMRAAIAAGFPRLLTPERILHELRYFCCEEQLPRVLEAALRENLLSACFGTQPSDSLLSSIQRLSRQGCRPELLLIRILAAMPEGSGLPVTCEEREAARSVRRSAAVVSRLARLKRPSTVYRLLKPVPEPALRIIASESLPPVAHTIATFLDRLAAVEPMLCGKDLAGLGIRPGPAYRTVLGRLRDARLDGLVRTREDELALARRLLRRRKS